MSICNFGQYCIYVFVFVFICKSDTREHCFWGPLTITFSGISGEYGDSDGYGDSGEYGDYGDSD